MAFVAYWASGYTASDIQRFDNHCESYSALEVVYNAPIAIRYSVTGTSIAYISVNIFRIELKFANYSYFKVFFLQNL